MFLERDNVPRYWYANVTLAGINYCYMKGLYPNTGISPTRFRYVDWLFTVPMICTRFCLLLRPVGAQPGSLVRLEAPAIAAAPVVVAVHGRISDTGGQPLPGATVLAHGTPLATSASASGDYSLTVPTGSVLQFGYGGYVDKTLPATPGALA